MANFIGSLPFVALAALLPALAPRARADDEMKEKPKAKPLALYTQAELPAGVAIANANLDSAYTELGNGGVWAGLGRVPEGVEMMRETLAEAERFYELWQGKPGVRALPPAEALRQAQAFVREHPEHKEWKHPYFWAAWSLWGLPN